MNVYPLSKDIPCYKKLSKGDRVATHAFGWVTVVHKFSNYVIVKLDEPVDGSSAVQMSFGRLKRHVPVIGGARAVKKKLRDAEKQLLADLCFKYDKFVREAGYNGLGRDFDSLGKFEKWVKGYIELYGNVSVESLLDSNDYLFVPDVEDVTGMKLGKKKINCPNGRSCIMPKELVAWFRFVSKPICDVMYVFAGKGYIRYRRDGKDVREYCQFVREVDDAVTILPYYSDLVCRRFDEIEARYNKFPELVKFKVEEVKKMVRGLSSDDRNVLYDVRAV